jgi:hypothetical protein
MRRKSYFFAARPQQKGDGGTSADAEDFACGEHEPGHPQQGSVCCQVTNYRPIYNGLHKGLIINMYN